MRSQDEMTERCPLCRRLASALIRRWGDDLAVCARCRHETPDVLFVYGESLWGEGDRDIVRLWLGYKREARV